MWSDTTLVFCVLIFSTAVGELQCLALNLSTATSFVVVPLQLRYCSAVVMHLPTLCGFLLDVFFGAIHIVPISTWFYGSGKALSSGFLLMIPRAGVASMAVLFSFEI